VKRDDVVAPKGEAKGARGDEGTRPPGQGREEGRREGRKGEGRREQGSGG
jgi:hypothetical protein